MHNILIVGGGKVGIYALEYCKKEKYNAIIIDNDSNCLASKYVESIYYFNEINDYNELFGYKNILLIMNISDLSKILLNLDFEYVVPAIPIHLMAVLALEYLKAKNVNIKPSSYLIKQIRKKIAPELIISFNESDGILISSFMPKEEQCLPNCTEHLKCPKTGIVKPKPLYDIFKDITDDLASLILISEQLKPNLGGFSRNSIRKFYEFLNSIENDFIIGTACMCHGILNAFELRKINED
ncbi:MAG: hypothetical protein ACTSPQ_04045 [Candidatus Helarchaeota archaeon]